MIVKEKSDLKNWGDFVKVVIDIEKKILSIGCELHIDCADDLVTDGSERKNLWGANIYPIEKKIDFISMINIRPLDNNRSMEIQIPEIKEKVEGVIKEFIF